MKEGNIAWLLPLHTCAQCHPWAARAFLRQSRDTKKRSDGYDDVVVLTARLSGTARRHVARRRRGHRSRRVTAATNQAAAIHRRPVQHRGGLTKSTSQGSTTPKFYVWARDQTRACWNFPSTSKALRPIFFVLQSEIRPVLLAKRSRLSPSCRRRIENCPGIARSETKHFDAGDLLDAPAILGIWTEKLQPRVFNECFGVLC